jgi:hypothetical protein
MGGRHYDPKPNISNYTPTIKAHRFTQTRSLKHLAEEGQNVLVVLMSETPGEPVLDRESHLISRSIEPIIPVIFPQPTKLQVVRELKKVPTSTMVHFICHGISNA